ncbi:MAG TPA: hypothetical protein VN887_03220 [Candidatus Angelobacter sp.]|nr:hypothetical protein [Candidatus Angelobacter sp.]
MPSPPPSEGQPRTSPSPSQPAVTDSSTKLLHALISASAAILCLSFFLPWIKILEVGVSGLDIQKNFESYRLVWLMPLLAIVTLVLGIAGLNTGFVRRLAGLCPFAILIYATSRLGGDLLNQLGIGAWLALIAGAALIFIPGKRKTPA